jgi:hypothetical protein
MLRRFWYLIPVLALATVAVAGTVVDQGQGNARAIPWNVSAGGGYMAAGAPAFNLSVGVGGANSGAVALGATYRIACSGPVFFRVDAGGSTAVVTDTPIYGPAVEYVAIRGVTGSMFYFITAAGTVSCVGTRFN